MTKVILHKQCWGYYILIHTQNVICHLSVLV